MDYQDKDKIDTVKCDCEVKMVSIIMYLLNDVMGQTAE